MKTEAQSLMIKGPIVIVYEGIDNKISTAIYAHPKASRYEHFGLLVCDLVRHVSKAFRVSEDDVWRWVDKERDRPTTAITGGPPQ